LPRSLLALTPVKKPGGSRASALEQGFRAGGWKGALTNAIQARQAQRKAGYSSAFSIAVLYADLGDKDEAFRWLKTAYQERDCNWKA